jgi:flagellar hook-length control protein FliK
VIISTHVPPAVAASNATPLTYVAGSSQVTGLSQAVDFLSLLALVLTAGATTSPEPSIEPSVVPTLPPSHSETVHSPTTAAKAVSSGITPARKNLGEPEAPARAIPCWHFGLSDTHAKPISKTSAGAAAPVSAIAALVAVAASSQAPSPTVVATVPSVNHNLDGPRQSSPPSTADALPLAPVGTQEGDHGVESPSVLSAIRQSADATVPGRYAVTVVSATADPAQQPPSRTWTAAGDIGAIARTAPAANLAPNVSVVPHPTAPAVRNLQILTDGIGTNLDGLQQTGHAVLHLDLSPPELGRVRVQLTAHGSEINVRLTVQSDAARHAVVSQVEALRDRLGELGVILGQFDVRHEAGGSPFQQQSHAQDSAPPARGPAKREAPNAAAVRPAADRGGIDLMA